MWQKHFGVFWVRSSNCCSLTKCERQVPQGSVTTLFRWARKSLNYSIANLFRTICAKFYQNRLGFVEDMKKNILVCFFQFTAYIPVVFPCFFYVKCEMQIKFLVVTNCTFEPSPLFYEIGHHTPWRYKHLVVEIHPLQEYNIKIRLCSNKAVAINTKVWKMFT